MTAHLAGGGAPIERRRLGLALAALLLGLGGCRSVRVEVVSTDPTPPGASPGSRSGAASVGLATSQATPSPPPTVAPTSTTSPATATPRTEPTTATPMPAEAVATAPPNQPATSFPPPAVTQTASGAISASGQKDRYQVEARQGQLFEARVKRTSGISLQPVLELLDPTGASEASTFGISDESLLSRHLASTGTYTLVVSGSGQGPYTVAWSLDRYGQLVSGGQASAEITEKDQLDRYRLVGQQGQLLDARVQRTSGISLTPSLTLFDPMGLQETTGSWGFQGESHLQRKLASSGTYVLGVAGPGLGPYTVQITVQ